LKRTKHAVQVFIKGLAAVATVVLAQLPDQGAAIGPYFGLLLYNNGTAIFLVSWLFISQFRRGWKRRG